jgi:hypothetical protein
MLHGRRDQQAGRGSHRAKCAGIEHARNAAEMREAGLECGVQVKSQENLSSEDQEARLVERGFDLAMRGSVTGTIPL